ncbi:MAG: hypothetical protein DMD89_20835 [Candidatus Rokuibacteriota bacterium]|nr:MAG: hypothetical protein DMD89_20835 [Candidatus Rokubacteria bacterium]
MSSSGPTTTARRPRPSWPYSRNRVSGKPGAVHNVVLIHIVPHGDLLQEPSRWIGQRVSIVGRLFHSHTGHHRSRILIWPTSIGPG